MSDYFILSSYVCSNIVANIQSEGPIVDKSPTRKLEVSVDETG